MSEHRLRDPFAFEFGRAPVRRVIIEALVEPGMREQPRIGTGKTGKATPRKVRPAIEIPTVR